MNAAEQALRRDSADFFERLTNRREAWHGECGGLDVIKTDHGDIARDTKLFVLERSNGADRSNVIEGNQRSEFALRCQELAHDRIAQFG